MEPEQAKYPEEWRILSLDRQPLALFLDRPATIISTLDPHAAIPEEHRAYLLRHGITTILIIPLVSGGQVYGRLTFGFSHERKFDSEELEFTRGLATQGSFAIQLARFVEAARQTALLEERNRLAREMHDSLVQTFVGIAMHGLERIERRPQ